MQGLNILNVYPETIADGYGLRYAIYLAGCRHACLGCHNPESWRADAGQPLTGAILERIIREIKDNILLDGITLTGGDPFYNPAALYELLERLKRETRKNIWCYTGYVYNEVKNLPVLKEINVLVDGPFILAQRDLDFPYRGSRNQRLIDVTASLEKGEAVDFEL